MATVSLSLAEAFLVVKAKLEEKHPDDPDGGEGVPVSDGELAAYLRDLALFDYRDAVSAAQQAANEYLQALRGGMQYGNIAVESMPDCFSITPMPWGRFPEQEDYEQIYRGCGDLATLSDTHAHVDLTQAAATFAAKRGELDQKISESGFSSVSRYDLDQTQKLASWTHRHQRIRSWGIHTDIKTWLGEALTAAEKDPRRSAGNLRPASKAELSTPAFGLGGGSGIPL